MELKRKNNLEELEWTETIMLYKTMKKTNKRRKSNIHQQREAKKETDQEEVEEIETITPELKKLNSSLTQITTFWVLANQDQPLLFPNHLLKMIFQDSQLKWVEDPKI